MHDLGEGHAALGRYETDSFVHAEGAGGVLAVHAQGGVVHALGFEHVHRLVEEGGGKTLLAPGAAYTEVSDPGSLDTVALVFLGAEEVYRESSDFFTIE